MWYDKLKYWTKRRSHHISVYDDKVNITYRDFDQITDHIASWLQFYYGKKQRIAVKIPHSIQQIIIAIAILKSNNIYVPIDDQANENYVEDIIEGTNAILIIQQTKVNEYQIPSVTLDEIQRQKVDRDHTYCEDPKNEVYIIHTSGTTGKPKGVIITQENLDYILENLQEKSPVDESSTYLFSTPYTFDVSISEIFGWIYGGAKVYTPDISDASLFSKITEIIAQEKITHLAISPAGFLSMIKFMNEDQFIKNLEGLKYVTVAGEAFQSKIHEFYLKNNLNFTLYNAYGPTEATVYATYFQLPKIAMGAIPIGTILKDAYYRILKDQQGRGILHLGGKGISKGYTDPSLDKERFVAIQGRRYYNTGDIVSESKGVLYYHGRNDSQIQRNGVRVELQEIEYRIARLNEIMEVRISFIDNRIIAFIHSNLNRVDLYKKLYYSLPKYELPDVIIEIEEFPKTRHGKIDMKSLKNVYNKHKKGNFHTLNLRKSLQVEKLLEVFHTVLGKEVHENDDFFELGGDSLTALEIILQAEEILERRFDTSIIYIYRKIGDIIREMIKEVREIEQEQGLLDIEKLVQQCKDFQNQPYEIEEVFETINSQRVYYYDHVESIIPIVFQVKELEDSANLFADLFAHHEMLRALIHEDENKLYFNIISEINQIPRIKVSKKLNPSMISQIIEKTKNLVYQARYNNRLLSLPMVLSDPESIYFILLLDHTIADLATKDILMKHMGHLIRGELLPSTNIFRDFCQKTRKNNKLEEMKEHPLHKKYRKVIEKVDAKFVLSREKGVFFKELELIKKTNLEEKIIYQVGQELETCFNNPEFLISVIYNDRKKFMQPFANTVGDCHKTIYYIYKKRENWSSFESVNRHLHDSKNETYAFYRPVYPIYSTYPYFSEKQEEEKKILDLMSLVSFNFMGIMSSNDKVSYEQNFTKIYEQLERTYDAIYVTSFICNNKIYIYANRKINETFKRLKQEGVDARQKA